MYCSHNLHDPATYIWFMQLVRAVLIPVFFISESLSLHIVCDIEARLRDV